MEKPDKLSLGHHLANRLYPLTLGIGILISLGLPATYFLLESNSLRQTANLYARELSEKLQDFILEAPTLRKDQTQEYSRVLHAFLPHKDLVFIRILDGKGQPITEYDHVSSKAKEWRNFYPAVGAAVIIFNNRKAGTVQVGVSQGALIGLTLVYLLLSSAVGGVLAVLVYLFPVRVVTEMEGQIQELLETLQRSEGLQKLLKELNQDIAALDIDSLLKKLTIKGRELLGVDVADVGILERGRWYVKGFSGIALDAVPGNHIEIAGGASTWIVKNRRPLTIPDITRAEEFASGETLQALGLRGYLGVPIFSRDRQVMGVFRALTYQPRGFTQEEVDLSQQLANSAAIAIENTMLFNEVQKKSKELEEAIKTKSDFLNTLAHELRTPLIVITGNTQLLKDGIYGPLDEKAKKGIEVISRSSHSLINLIDEFLDLARLEAKRVPLRIEEFSLKEMTDELEAFFKPLVKERGLGLSFYLDDAIPRLKSDRSKVEEILQNLLANAIKYTERGKIELRVSYQSDGQPGRPQGGRISFAIRDTGIGIKETDMPHISEAFYMAEGVDRRKYPSTGLGLSIVRRLVELLSGDFQIESQWGKGSTFTVTLPVVHPSEP